MCIQEPPHVGAATALARFYDAGVAAVAGPGPCAVGAAGLPRDVPRALALLRYAAEQRQHPDALYLLGTRCCCCFATT